MTVYDGADAPAPVLGHLNGTALSHAVRSTRADMFVAISSDTDNICIDLNTTPGFLADWTFIDPCRFDHSECDEPHPSMLCLNATDGQRECVPATCSLPTARWQTPWTARLDTTPGEEFPTIRDLCSSGLVAIRECTARWLQQPTKHQLQAAEGDAGIIATQICLERRFDSLECFKEETGEERQTLEDLHRTACGRAKLRGCGDSLLGVLSSTDVRRLTFAEYRETLQSKHRTTTAAADDCSAAFGNRHSYLAEIAGAVHVDVAQTTSQHIDAVQHQATMPTMNGDATGGVAYVAVTSVATTSWPAQGKNESTIEMLQLFVRACAAWAAEAMMPTTFALGLWACATAFFAPCSRADDHSRGMGIKYSRWLLLLVLSPSPLVVAGGVNNDARRALQSQAITQANIITAKNTCLGQSGIGDCPNSGYGHIRDWDTSAVTDMRNSECAAHRLAHAPTGSSAAAATPNCSARVAACESRARRRPSAPCSSQAVARWRVVCCGGSSALPLFASLV